MKSEITNDWLKLLLLEYMTEYTRTKFQTHWRFFYIIVFLKSNIMSAIFLSSLNNKKNKYHLVSHVSQNVWMKQASIQCLQK